MATASPVRAQAAPPPPPPAGVAAIHVERRGLLTLAVMLATVIQILDSTIANVALPHMRATLGATPDEMSWVLTSYIVAAGIAIPITGWLSDRIGSRNLFLLAVGGFVVASAMCGAAQSLTQMVLFRLLQGITAAFMSPVGQTVLLDINPPERQAKAMSIWGMGIMVAPISGPVIGGWLTENFSWRWVFYVNLPLGIVCFALLWWLLPSRPLIKRHFDAFGFTVLAIGIGSLQLLLDRGQGKDWFSSTEVWIELIAAVIAFWMFTIHMITARQPMFEREIFKDRNLITSSVFMAIMSMVMMGAMALLPTMMQTLYGHSVLETGMMMMPRGVGMVLMMLVTTQLSQRGVDVRLLLAAGFAIVAYSAWTMSHWSIDMGSMPILVSGFIQGIGTGLLFMPVTVIAFSSLSARFRTEASSVLNLARSLGASVGISIITSLLARNMQISHADLAQHVTAQGLDTLDPNLLGALGTSGDAVMMMVDGEVSRQALMIAYLDDFLMMAVVTACAIPLVLLLRTPKGPVVNDPGALGH